MKLHRMTVDRAVYGPNREKITKSSQVLADASETFGVYHDKLDKYSRFVVTHIPTGYMSGSTITQRAARELMERLLALPIDWRENDADKLKTAINGDERGCIREIINGYRGI